MSHSLEKLQTLTDDELIKAHDKHAEHTVVGINYYLTELQRRSNARSSELANQLAHDSKALAEETKALAVKSQELSRWSFRLTIANTALAVVATVAAVIALFLR